MKEHGNGNGRRPVSGLRRWIPVLFVLAVAIGIYLTRPAARSPAEDTPPADTPTETTAALPRLLDLGADKCVPCKMMAPILEELKSEYAGTFAVEFIDVWKNTGASGEYGIQVIPTQIFFAADGAELFRHEGFFGKEEILAKWRELGIEI